MRKRLRLVPVLFFLALSGSVPVMSGCESGSPTGPGASCCKVCKTGKACGDTCIARDKTCRTSGGCACNG